MDGGSAWTADITDRGKTVEGIDHPVQKAKSNKEKAIEAREVVGWAKDVCLQKGKKEPNMYPSQNTMDGVGHPV